MGWPEEARFALRHELHHGRVVRGYADRPADVDAILRAAAARFPARDAIVFGDGRTSYRDLDATVDRLAGNLAGLGLRQGDRIAVLLGNRPEFVHVVMAAARLGAIAVPMNVRQRRPETAFALNQSGAAALVFEADLVPHLPPPDEVPALRHRIAVAGEAAGALPWDRLLAPASAPAVRVDEDDVAQILYTSGTTGRPKGAMLTHFGQANAVTQFAHCQRLRDGAEVCFLTVPGSHVTGLTAIVLTMLNVAGTIVIMPEFKAEPFLRLAERERMTYGIMVPAMYNLCLMQPVLSHLDLSAWKVGAYGGAPMPTATIDRMAELLPGVVLVNAYGATETTSAVTQMPHGMTRGHEDSVGRVLPTADIVVMDERGREVPAGEPGELWIAGAVTVPGYWDNEAATADNFAGGYWKSGDVGSIDADGFVRVFDRYKDMINRGGFKVYCIEVENVLKQLDGVVEVAVVARPDPVLGEKVQAFVCAEPGRVDAAGLRAFAAGLLSDYKVPDVVTFLDRPLPRNPNGKVLKPELRRLAEADAARS